jgi:hypothetical protein
MKKTLGKSIPLEEISKIEWWKFKGFENTAKAMTQVTHESATRVFEVISGKNAIGFSLDINERTFLFAVVILTNSDVSL